jgi:NAD(P)-dependent dehydrogenase (short-subunit alcohol dehydrogenase family)
MKCAIVTGAGSGIGRGVAVRLVKEGYGVVLAGRREGRLEETAKVIREQRGAAAMVRVVPADVTKEGEVDVMVAKAMDGFGRVDVLVNCAGSAPAVPLMKVTPVQWREILESNLSASFYTMRAVWPVMQKQFEVAKSAGEAAPLGGVVVNISSMASRDPFPGLGAYGAAKAGLNMLTLAAGREGKDAGIRVVGISPAAVDTEMFHGLMGGKAIPPGVMLEVEDVVSLVWEAIGGALKYCSGETVFVHRRPA